MKMTNITYKFVLVACFIGLTALFTACGDNPIEVERDNYNELYLQRSEVMKDLYKEIPNTDFYACKQVSGEDSCKLFYKVCGKYEFCDELIVDTTEVDTTVVDTTEVDTTVVDTTEVDTTVVDTTEVDTTVVDTTEVDTTVVDTTTTDTTTVDTTTTDTAEVIHYLTENKSLNLTITHYKQNVEVFAVDDTVADPEIKFYVKIFSEDEQVNKLPTHILLSKENVAEWEGSKGAAVSIPRGMNKLEICPVVMDLNEDEDIEISSGECITVDDLGLIEDRKVTAEVDSTSEKFTLEWEWFLY